MINMHETKKKVLNWTAIGVIVGAVAVLPTVAIWDSRAVGIWELPPKVQSIEARLNEHENNNQTNFASVTLRLQQSDEKINNMDKKLDTIINVLKDVKTNLIWIGH
jgi:guanylate kinase